MKKLSYFLLAVVVVILFSYAYFKKDYKRTPATLYTNGHFITLDEQTPTAEAMLVENGVIKAIGTNESVVSLKTEDISVVDLQQAVVMPGFVDPHTHFVLSMILAQMHDLSGFKHESNKAVWAHFEEVARQTEKGKWIICKGIDPILISDLKPPSLHYLDSIAPHNPVLMLSQSLHNYLVNSAALQKAGITKATPNPTANSYYEKNEAGDFTGLIVEQEAVQPIMKVIEKEVFTPKSLTQAANKVMAAYAQNGNTTLVSTGLTINDDKPLILLKHLSDNSLSLLGGALEKMGKLPKRKPNPRHFIYIRHDRTQLLPKMPTENDFYNIIGVKHWMDGSPYIGTMYLDEPYLDTELTNDKLHIPKQHRGEALIEKTSLEKFIKDYHTAGWQIAIHTQGDAAIREVLDVFETLDKTINIKSARHRLEHCLLLPTSELDRVKALNVTPSFHINHLYYYGDALKTDLLGLERAERILPLAATQQKGIKYSLHADQPMFESKPFRLIQTAVERHTKSGDSIAVAQKITLLEALQAMTIDAAWQINMEDKIGSLKKGKYADFIILDKNPFEVSTDQLENIQCLQTFVHGNQVYPEMTK